MKWEAWLLLVYVLAMCLANLEAIRRPDGTGSVRVVAFLLIFYAGLIWLLMRLAGVL